MVAYLSKYCRVATEYVHTSTWLEASMFLAVQWPDNKWPPEALAGGLISAVRASHPHSIPVTREPSPGTYSAPPGSRPRPEGQVLCLGCPNTVISPFSIPSSSLCLSSTNHCPSLPPSPAILDTPRVAAGNADLSIFIFHVFLFVVPCSCHSLSRWQTYRRLL